MRLGIDMQCLQSRLADAQVNLVKPSKSKAIRFLVTSIFDIEISIGNSIPILILYRNVMSKFDIQI